MEKIIKRFSFIAYPLIISLVFLGVPLPSFAQETITITTYYPSPAGVYQNLTTDNLTVNTSINAANVDLTIRDITARNITALGNVGINTTQPSERLDVNGNIQVTGSHRIYFGDDGTGEYIYSQRSGNFPLIFAAGSQDRMAILNNGRVGIGTTNPRTPLEVVGPSNATFGGVARFTNTSNGVRQVMRLSRSVSPTSTIGGVSMDFVPNLSRGGRWYELFATDNGNTEGAGKFIIRDNSASANRVIVDSSGRVGIRSLNPETTLDVNGDVSSEAVDLGVHAVGSRIRFENYPGNERRIYNGRFTLSEVEWPGMGVVIGARRRTLNIYGTMVWDPNASGDLWSWGYDTSYAQFVLLVDGQSGGRACPGGCNPRVMFEAQPWTGDLRIFRNCIAVAHPIYSSLRFKKNIKPIEDALEKVMKLRGVEFDWDRDGKHSVGLIAEEVVKVVPEAIGYDKNGDVETVSHEHFTGILIEAIKTQQKQIDGLKQELSSIRKALKPLSR